MTKQLSTHTHFVYERKGTRHTKSSIDLVTINIKRINIDLCADKWRGRIYCGWWYENKGKKQDMKSIENGTIKKAERQIE
jgi:hypothetical protein